VYSPFAHLSFWHAASSLPLEPPPSYPFAAPGTEASDAAARRLAAQLAASGPEARRELLGVLHGRSALLPWGSLHPSWLADILADVPPSWRGWALGTLPGALREKLAEESASSGSGGPEPAGVPPPSWWRGWFTAHVKARLGYPDLAPWPVSSELPGSLWEREEAELNRLLAVWGTRGFISAVRALPRAEAQRWIWALPPACHAVADDTVRGRRWSDDPFWPEAFASLAREFPQVEARLIRMALADLLRAGVQQKQESELRRLALRLPRRWGTWVLVELAARPRWLELPVLPSIAAWREALQADLDRSAPPRQVEP
jgi:hypothetical protein